MLNDNLQDPDEMYNTGTRKEAKKQRQSNTSFVNEKKIKEILPDVSDRDISESLRKYQGNLKLALEYLMKQNNTTVKQNVVTKHLQMLDNFVKDESPTPQLKFDDFGFFFDEDQSISVVNQDDYAIQYSQLQNTLEEIMDEEEVHKMMEDCQQQIQKWMQAQQQAQQQSIYYNETIIVQDQFLYDIQEFIEGRLELEKTQRKQLAYDQNSQEDFPSLSKSNQQNKNYNDYDQLSEQMQIVGFHHDQTKHLNQSDNYWQKKPEENKLYEINNSCSQAIQQLCHDFPQLDLDKVKIAFDYINDYHGTKEFLISHCPQYYQERTVKQPAYKSNDGTWIRVGEAKQNPKSFNSSQLSGDYQQLRSEINEIKLKFYCLQKRKDSSNTNSIKSLLQLQKNKLSALQSRSHEVLLKLIGSSSQNNVIDLHGIWGDEVIDLLTGFIQTRRNKQVEIITGRG